MAIKILGASSPEHASSDEGNLMSPLITVIIPAYNASSYIARTLESVIRQDDIRWECVVVDDGCADDTALVVEKYARRDSRIKLVRQANKGVGPARNRGLQESRPDTSYFVFMDCDDLFLPGALRAMQDGFDGNPDYVGVHGLADMIDVEDKGLEEGGFRAYLKHRRKVRNGVFVACQPTDPTELDVVLSSPIYPPGIVMVRADVLKTAGEFDTTLRGTGDLDMWIRIARMGSLRFIERTLVHYRRHANNESNLPAYMWREIRYVRWKAWCSPKNTHQHRGQIRDFYRALQRAKISENLNQVRNAWQERDISAAIVSSARSALHFMLFLKSSPSPLG